MALHCYALVVMDAYLTGLLHGRPAEFLERVHRLCPDARIILLTAYGTQELVASVDTPQDLTVVAKPQPVVYLGEVIDGFLDHGTLPDALSRRPA